MILTRIDTGETQDVALPAILDVYRTEEDGDTVSTVGYDVSPDDAEWLGAVQQWALFHGFEAPQELPKGYAQWDESKHPRQPEGSSEGGEFAPAGAFANLTLSSEEKNSLFEYSVTDYYPMNALLRFGSKVEDDYASQYDFPRLKRQIADLDAVIARSHVKSDVQVFRGVRGSAAKEQFDKAKVGDTFTDKGFVSTSIAKTVGDKYQGDVRVFITLKKGSPAAYIGDVASNKNDQEVVLPRGSKFLITKKDVRGGKIIVHAERL